MAVNDQNRKKPKPGEPGYVPPTGAFTAGALARQGIADQASTTANQFARAGAAIVSPFVRPIAAASEFTRGLAGASPSLATPPAVASPAAVQQPPVTRLDPVVVTPAQPLSRAAGSGIARPSTLQPAVATGVQRTLVNGVPTYSNVRSQSASAPAAATASQPGVPPLSAPVVQPIRPPTLVASSSTVPQVQAATGQAVNQVRSAAAETRNAGAGILDPRSADAELMRRAEIAQSSYFNRGRPSARNAIAQAYLDKIGGRDAASAQAQKDIAAAATAGAEQEAQAADAFAGRRDRMGLAAQDFDLEQQRIRAPQYVTDVAGQYLSVRDGVAQPVTDGTGQAIRMPRAPAEGQITPALQLASLDKQYQAEAALAAEPSASPEARAATAMRMQQLDAQRQQLLGAGTVQQPATATNPKTGERLRLNPATGQWEPIK